MLVTSEQVDQVFPAFIKAQSTLDNVGKTHKVSAGRGATYKHAKLEDVVSEVLPKLNAQGLAVLQSQDPTVSGDVVIATRLVHVSGQWIEGYSRVPTDRQPGPQGTGSAHSYARRYALLALVGIATEDDDGKPREPQRQPESWSSHAVERIASEVESGPPDRAGFVRLWFARLQKATPKRLEDDERKPLQARLFGYESLRDIPDHEINPKLEKLRAMSDEALSTLIAAKLEQIRNG